LAGRRFHVIDKRVLCGRGSINGFHGRARNVEDYCQQPCKPHPFAQHVQQAPKTW
jgi:hypothetical protein